MSAVLSHSVIFSNGGERLCSEWPILLMAFSLGLESVGFPVVGSGDEVKASGSKKKRILSPDVRK